MAHTYSDSLTSELHQLRFRIGDTVDFTAKQESLTDAEITYVLSQYPDRLQAAIAACRRLMARLRKKITYTAGGVSSQQREKLDGMKTTLDELLAEAKGNVAMDAYAGQISQARKDAAKDDTDYPQPDFTVGMDDNSGGT